MLQCVCLCALAFCGESDTDLGKEAFPTAAAFQILSVFEKTLFNTKTLCFFDPDLNVKLLLFKSLVFSEKTLFNT